MSKRNQNKCERFFPRSLTLGLALLALLGADSIHADIDRVERIGTCRSSNGRTLPKLVRGTSPTVKVVGAWQDYAESVRCSTNGCRITGRVVNKGGGFSKQGPFADLRLTVPNNERFGRKNLRVSHRTLAGVGTDTFQVEVARPQITGISAGNSPSSFFDRMTITIEGNGLPEGQNNVRVAPIANLQGGSLLQGGAAGIRITDRQWIRDSATRGRLILQFQDRMQRAVVDVSMSNPLNLCVVTDRRPRRVTLQTTARDDQNYVSSIRSDNRNVLSPGNLVSFTVRLRNQVSRRSRRGETVFWRVLPSNSFRRSDGNTPLPNLTQLRISPGRQEGVIQFFIDQCSGSATSMTATLETFMHDTSAATAPERFTQTFRVNCPRRR